MQYTWKQCPIQSSTSHFQQYVVVQCFTVFPVWCLFLFAHTWHEHWHFSSSVACVAGILYKKMISPCESASWISSPTMYLNFHTSTSKQSFGDFFRENFEQNFFLVCFGIQDVCINNCQVEQMKEKFLPPFYHLPFKRIIWQHLVWSVHNTFTLIVLQHCRCFYFMMCPHVVGAPTSISSWAMLKRKT